MVTNPKAEMFAPCGVPTGKPNDYRYPTVLCSYDCRTCGWNPVERRRREETGEWKPMETRLNIETEEVIRLNGVKQLVFRRADEPI